MVKKIIYMSLAIAAMCSCDRLDVKGMFVPTSDQVNTRFEESIALTGDKSTATIEVQDQYMFYVCTDAHIFETTDNLDKFNNAFRNDPYASFAVNLGDCVDTYDNFPRFAQAVEYQPEKHQYDYKIFHVLGNHDLFFDSWDDYKTHLGAAVYWFEVDGPTFNDLYISLDSSTATLGKKQTKWLKNFLSENRDKYRHCMILTHTNFFNTDNSQNTSGNFALEEFYNLLDILTEKEVTLVLQGHDHHREDLTFEGVRYTVVGTIRDEFEEPEYLKVTVTDQGVEYDWVEMK